VKHTTVSQDSNYKSVPNILFVPNILLSHDSEPFIKIKPINSNTTPACRHYL